jgi:hypothetical protein
MANSKRNAHIHSKKQAALFPPTGAPKARLRDAEDGCEVVAVGKRRDGGTRYWCLRHKADATAKYGRRSNQCRAARVVPISEQETFVLDVDKYKGGIALWGAVPAVYDTTTLPMDRGIHVHARVRADAEKEMDRTFRAVRIVSSRLADGGILISELDAIYYMVSSVFGYQVNDVRCTYCGYEHLDRDWFSVHPHHRHLCAGCGKHFRDSQVGIGNPIAALQQAWGGSASKPVLSKRRLDIRQADFPGGIQVWGSNPAFLWTANRPEEEGIHVHAFKRPDEEVPDEDETFSEVVVDGTRLDAQMVRLLMAQNVMPSLKNRVRSLDCPKCSMAVYATGMAAYSPSSERKCSHCGHEVATPGRVRKVVANPLIGVLAQLAKDAPRQPRTHDLQLLPETL